MLFSKSDYQNMAVHPEAPFMFLLFGNDRTMLLDTGATRSPEFFPLRQTVDELVVQWLARHLCTREPAWPS